MLLYFPGLKRTYYVICMLTILASLAIFSGVVIGPEERFWYAFPIWIALLLLAVLLIATIMGMVANRRYNTQVRACYSRCNMGEYIGLIQEMLGYSKRKSRVRNVLLYDLSSGYMLLGRPGDAMAVLQGHFPLDGSRTLEATLNLAYYNSLVCYHLMCGDAPGARRSLAELKQCLESTKIPENLRPAQTAYYAEKACLTDMAEGNYEGAKRFFTNALEFGKTPLEKVKASYHLARIHLHEGDTANAEKEFAYVAEFGGDTRYAQWARAYLAKSPGLPSQLPV